MSNDKDKARLIDLMGKVLMMVSDGKRDARTVADWLQKLVNERSFVPATFMDKGWSYEGERDARSAAIGLLDNYSKVKFSTSWLKGGVRVSGKVRRCRILEDRFFVPLNCDHFFDLWNNKEKIPEEWKTVKGMITFDGDVLRDSVGGHFVMCLKWNSGEWIWSCDWLNNLWSVDDPSAGLEI